MKLSVALFAFFVFPALVTSIPPLGSVNDGYVDVSVTAKRLNEQSVDKRQLSDAMYGIVNAVIAYADEYNHYRGYARSDFTQDVVGALYSYNPQFNYIICHGDHDYNFGSPWGVNVYNVWVDYQVKRFFGTANIGYDVVIGKNGTFTRNGDGGFLNWAYIGYVISTSDDGSVVTFGNPG